MSPVLAYGRLSLCLLGLWAASQVTSMPARTPAAPGLQPGPAADPAPAPVGVHATTTHGTTAHGTTAHATRAHDTEGGPV